MANDFDDIRLPENIERGANGGPSFRTTIISLVGGAEQRNEEWERTRGQYNIGYGIQKRKDLEAVYSFFHARRGMSRGFRFRDWIDFEVKASVVGLVDGAPNQRQLVRVYDDEVNPYVRVVTRPIASTLRVYINNVATNAYTLGELGVITFTGGDPGPNVLVDFQYDIPVRFDIDTLPVQLNTYQEGSIPAIIIVELAE